MANILTFHTSRLVLREVCESDIPTYQRLFNDYKVIRTLSAIVPWPYPDNGVAEFLFSQVFPYQGIDKWFWAITLAENPSEMIGSIGLWREGKPDHRGFWLGHKFWGKGYMTEAVEPVMDYAFAELGFETLVFTRRKPALD